MSLELVPVSFHKIMQSRHYTVIILAAPDKRFAIYTDSHVGKSIQSFLTQEKRPRPLTHELVSSIFSGLGVKILQVVINDIEDTIYFARLFLEQKVGEEAHILEIDARPSDCIPLALMNQVPLFCRKDILDKAVPISE